MTSQQSISHSTGGLSRQILALAWPALLTNITTPLMSLVDITVVGHLPSASLIAAIAIGSTLLNTLLWILNFLRTGTSGITAQAFGAADNHTISATLTRTLSIAMTIGIVILMLAPIFTPAAVALLNVDPSVAVQADTYLSITLFATPAVLATYALSGWFTGMQNTRPILVMSIVSTITNITLNITFVYGFNLDLEGVAIATAVAPYIGLLAAIPLLRRMLQKHNLQLMSVCQSFRHAKNAVLRLMTVNMHIFMRTLLLIIVTLHVTHAASAISSDTLAANTILMQLFTLFSYVVDSYAYAGEALAGFAIGAQKPHALRRAIRMLFIHATIISVIFTIIYLVSASGFIALLTSHHNIRAIAGEYAPYVTVIPLVAFAAFIWDGIYIGATLSLRMLMTMIVACAAYLITYYALSTCMSHDNSTIWTAFLVYLATRSLVQTLIFPRRLCRTTSAAK